MWIQKSAKQCRETIIDIPISQKTEKQCFSEFSNMSQNRYLHAGSVLDQNPDPNPDPEGQNDPKI
jgi:hypothetical protein